jgi:HEPN domain-containing protein
MLADNLALLAAVGAWVEKAENDLAAAAIMLSAGRRAPLDAICFHAQQCVEKYLKALLTWRELPFPRTHDITALVARLPQTSRPDFSPTQIDLLTRYATVTRYPGDYEPITLTETRRAVTLARRVRRQVRRLLPKAVL